MVSNTLLLLIALKTIGNDFVFGFIQAVDGEKVSWKILIFFATSKYIVATKVWAP